MMNLLLKKLRNCLPGAVVLLAFVATPQTAAALNIIQHYEVKNIQSITFTNAGHGLIDLSLMTTQNNALPNTFNDRTTGLTYNYDNGNNYINNNDKIWNQSYAISAAELKHYYLVNFSNLITADGLTLANPIQGVPGEVQVVLNLNLNETAGGGPINTLNKLEVLAFSDYTNITNLTVNPYGNDLLTAQQAAIAQAYTGGTLLAQLYTAPNQFDNLPLLAQGQGYADYAILTGVDPFTLNDTDILLFNISMSNLDNGGEEWFISGTYNIPPTFFTPEPTTGLLFGVGLAGLAWRRRRQQRSH